MKIVLPSLAAAALLAALSTSASALPIGPVPLDTQAGLVDQAGWAQSFERGGKRFLRTTKRHAPKRDVTATGNVDRPDRPRNQAGWGQMPGGQRRYGVR
ncbi:MAG TPA: hypothetical protein VF601_00445 [Beijerinckiaceae bacterium]|jgi:hypothetical protein